MLQLQKSGTLHRGTETVANFSSLFRDIENHEPPSLVPASPFLNPKRRKLLLKQECRLPRRSDPCIPLAIPLFKFYMPLLCKATKRRARSFAESPFSVAHFS